MRISLKLLFIVALILTAAFGVASAQETGDLRFVHAFVDAPDVDIYVNGDVVAEGVPYGAASDYIEVPAGDVEVSVTAAGEADELFSQTVTTGGQPVTLVVSSDAGFLPYVDNLDPLDLGETRITAIHAIPEGPAVDVILTDGRPVIPQLEYGIPFGTLDLPVIKLALNVVPTGTDITNALFADNIVLTPTTGTSYMVVVYGTLDAPEVMALAAPVNPSPGSGFLSLTHNVSGAPAVDVFADDNLIAAGLEPKASTVMFPILEGEHVLRITETDNTANVILEETITIARGTEAAATVESGDDGIVVSIETAGGEAVAAAPDAGAEVVEPETEVEVAEVEPEVVQPTPAPAQEVVQPTSAPAQEVVPAQPASGGDQPTARVIIDAGSNIQLRQYPDQNALSLGLAPSGAVMTVNGREGIPVQIEGLFSEELQREIDNYVDPAEDLDENDDLNPDTTWLNVTYTTPDGGEITAWVLAQFLSVTAPDGAEQRLADLPTIPNNAFGEAVNTEVTPPPTPDDAVVAIVFNLNPGVNLKIRRTPTTQGETLQLIPAGTVLELLGFEINEGELPGTEAADNAEWAYVRYTTPEGGEITGWVSTQYIQYQWRGDPIDFEEMEARALLLFEDPSTRGELGSGAQPIARPTIDPLRNQVVATVNIDPGANLQFRRDPNAGSESLGLIPSGTQLIVTARDASGEWLFVEFEGQTGWIAADFVRLTFNDNPFDVDELIVEGGAAVEEPAPPTVAPPTAAPPAVTEEATAEVG